MRHKRHEAQRRVGDDVRADDGVCVVARVAGLVVERQRAIVEQRVKVDRVGALLRLLQAVLLQSALCRLRRQRCARSRRRRRRRRWRRRALLRCRHKAGRQKLLDVAARQSRRLLCASVDDDAPTDAARAPTSRRMTWHSRSSGPFAASGSGAGGGSKTRCCASSCSSALWRWRSIRRAHSVSAAPTHAHTRINATHSRLSRSSENFCRHDSMSMMSSSFFAGASAATRDATIDDVSAARRQTVLTHAHSRRPSAAIRMRDRDPTRCRAALPRSTSRQA